jgi:CPA2 family monovalent cation:H+ antiporter-2
MQLGLLPSILILIATAIVVVITFKKLNLSPVLGYLVAGALIGDYGFDFVKFKDTEILAELGIVFLLFATGLELSFERLKAMRKYVFGLGSLQVFITASIIAGVSFLFIENRSVAVIIGGGLALSSTALVLQLIDANNRSNQIGRISLAILIQQDFIVVPLLVIIPLLAKGGDQASIFYAIMLAFVKAIVALIGIFIVGRLLLRPIFRIISSDNKFTNNELFIAATLFICLAAALGTEALGLSMALGAFAAGILVAETEFRQPAEESIQPFKGLLLGLFFMSVGMTINIQEMYDNSYYILLISSSLMVVKSLIVIGLCLLFGFGKATALRTGLLLSQGSEFAFILFRLAMENKILTETTGKTLLLAVTVTMAFTPLVYGMGLKIADKWLSDDEGKDVLDELKAGARDITNHVLIAGFGKVGRMASKMLLAEGINYIALDVNEKVVENASKEGVPIFKVDISHVDSLKALGVDRCLVAVIAIDNLITVKKAIKVITAHFPDLSIIVRTKDLSSASELYEAGATVIVPEVYELGLQLGGAVLDAIGISDYEIARIKTQFRAGNYVVAKQYKYIADDDSE